MTFLDAALEYERAGYSVIPVGIGEKQPKIKWTEFQKRKATVEEITEWWTKWPKANIGIVTGAISGIWVIDLDRYKEGYDQATELQYFESVITPMAVTPRGGLHLYFKAGAEPISGRADIFPGIDLRAEGNFITAPPSQNLEGKIYRWLEGFELPNVGLAQLGEDFLKHIINNSTLYKGNVESGNPGSPFFSQGRRDDDLFHLAYTLVKAKAHPDLIQKTLEIVALNCEPPFPISEAKIKILSAIKRAHDKDRNIAAEVREFVLSTNGIFSSTECYNVLQCSTLSQKKNVSICLKRLSEGKDKLIERFGNKNGTWRTVDQSEEIINYKNVDLASLDVKLPLKLNEYCELNPANIIVIAGESNAGKTALLLNVALENRFKWAVNYMSSEMKEGVELRKRLDKFRLPIQEWDPIKFQFRTDNFTDKIDPDGLNIIDYLDEGSDQEAYKMPARLREIADRLKKGIAFVAIQKDPKKDFGYGGVGTKNRARLYLTITTSNILKIEKCKMWKNELVNPNGKFCRFKLGGGCNFSFADKATEWQN